MTIRKDGQSNKGIETMLLTQQFKTYDGAAKRARFETNHCNNRYYYEVVRCVNGEPDKADYDAAKFKTYTWRLRRVARTTNARG